MRKVKGTEDLIMSIIIAIIITLICVWAWYVFVYEPVAGGVTKGLRADQYCVEGRETYGYWASDLIIDFNKIYYAKGLAIYITPGGQGMLSLHAEKIFVYVYDDKGDEIPIGYVGKIEDGDIGREMPCIVTGSLGAGKKNKCHHYEGPITKIKASAEQHPACYVSATFAYFHPLIRVIEFFTETDLITICSVDKLKVQLFHPCMQESTLVEGDCDGDGIEEIGWNHQFPIECEPDAVARHCTIERGTYVVQNMDNIRQMNFPGLPLLQVGARGGCEGVQTGCDIKIYFGKPVEDGLDPEGCDDPAVVWTHVTSFPNLDYDYIYSNPISVSNYVEIDTEATYHRKWCLKVESGGNCWINSIDVQSYKK
ncbi:MAG: hypothetical protein JSW73_04875 [Candidatus Woesearchaeota archaeon]|nr:MAG: hypothetical protein JSW73_04875 [Candidatus Woesearchaeota archaeon]